MKTVVHPLRLEDLKQPPMMSSGLFWLRVGEFLTEGVEFDGVVFFGALLRQEIKSQDVFASAALIFTIYF